jgi:hypothetical protein
MTEVGMGVVSAGKKRKKKRTRTGLQLLVLDRRLNLPRELDHAVDLLVALLALLPDLLKRFIHRMLAGEVVVDEVFGNGETLLHRLLARPVFAVSLALDL